LEQACRTRDEIDRLEAAMEGQPYTVLGSAKQVLQGGRRDRGRLVQGPTWVPTGAEGQTMSYNVLPIFPMVVQLTNGKLAQVSDAVASGMIARGEARPVCIHVLTGPAACADVVMDDPLWVNVYNLAGFPVDAHLGGTETDWCPNQGGILALNERLTPR
jgi:hypothetical protein